MLWVVHDEGEVGDEGGLGREEELVDRGRDGGGMEQGDRPHTRNSLHLSYRCLKFQDISESCLDYHLDVGKTLQVCS